MTVIHASNSRYFIQANVLINDLGEALIADFGLSLVMDPKTLRFSPHKHAYAGSVRWTAPEKLKPCEYSLSLKCDVYSFACLCVEVSPRSKAIPRITEYISRSFLAPIHSLTSLMMVP